MRCLLLFLLFFAKHPSVSSQKLRSWLGPSNFMTGAPASARYSFCFVPINGSLFVFGGESVKGLLGDFYRFDPEDLEWIPLDSTIFQGTPPSPRGGIRCTSVQASLYLFGGFGPRGLLNDLYRFNVDSFSWTLLDASVVTGQPPSPRTSFGFTTNLGKLYVFGGQTGVLQNDMYQFDPRLLEWKELKPADVRGAFPSERWEFGFTSIQGKLFLFGGATNDGFSNDLYSFDPAMAEWSVMNQSGVIPQPRYAGGMAFAGNKMFVFGGCCTGDIITGSQVANFGDTYEFNISTMQWKEVNASNFPARNFFGFASIGNSIFVFGGFNGNPTNLNSVDPTLGSNELRQFDVSTSAWSASITGYAVGNTPIGRYGAGMASLNDQLFLFGGRNGNGDMLSDFHRFDLARLQWEELTGSVLGSPPSPRAEFSFASIQNRIFLFGGQNATGSLRNELFLYDPSQLQWSQLQNFHGSNQLPSPRISAGLASSDANMYVFGGSGIEGVLNDLSVLDTEALKWSSLSGTGNPPGPRKNMCIGFVGKSLFIFGGIGSNEEILLDIFKFDVESSTWIELIYDAETSPPLRSFVGNVFFQQKMIIFGGISDGVVFNDMYQLDLQDLKWTLLKALSLPSPRYSASYASASNRLYLFGGNGGVGSGTLNDLMAIALPKDISWPAYAGFGFFLDVYDWDVLSLDPSVRNTLEERLTLCKGLFPCSLSITGKGVGSLWRSKDGAISCLSDFACQSVVLQSLDLTCDSLLSEYPVMEIESSLLQISNVSFQHCFSSGDGSAVQVYGIGAEVSVKNARFKDCHSASNGGAISLVGGILDILQSTFENCSALLGGGAISASEYQCYGSKVQAYSSVSVFSTHFQACQSFGNGGAIAASSISVSLNVSLCIFKHSWSQRSGGAIAVLSMAQALVRNSVFINNSVITSGGAISVLNSASVEVVGSIFQNNSALGSGGGAMYASDAELTARGLSFTGNIAHAGGGGALFWEGMFEPTVIPWCFSGSRTSEYGEVNCSTSNCTSCVLCEAGKFQIGQGMSSCPMCSAGKFSSAQGSSVCLTCVPGSYSEAGSTTCFDSRLSSESDDESDLFDVQSRSMQSEPAPSGSARVQVRTSNTYSVSICGEGNTAVYGGCLASSCKHLIVEGIPSGDSPAFVGIPFSLYLSKRDAYNQVILTDSSSLIQAQTSLNAKPETDLSVSIFGTAISTVHKGQAILSIYLKPTFAEIIPSLHVTKLKSIPYIFVKGIDSESTSLAYMQSQFFEVLLSVGSNICPRGYILVLDTTDRNLSMTSGICSKCLPGTYSIDPLYGISSQLPSCLNCPPAQNCKGGDDVEFEIGTWVPAGGIFMLIACPEGHQLYNSIQGVFSHDVQQCIKCLIDQYILDSNNSKFVCQTCPVGAICNGSQFHALVFGSVWEPDFSRGVYVLKYCPAGYELVAPTDVGQNCSLCSAGFYCVGGSNPQTACPSGTFSAPGANSSSSCTVAFFVEVTVSMPTSRQTFVASFQDNFEEALASTVGLSPAKLVIVSIVESGRRADSSVLINANLAADSQDSADAIPGRLNDASLNLELQAHGLPHATVISVVVASSSKVDSAQVLIAASTASGCVFLMLALAVSYYFLKKVYSRAAQRAFLHAIRNAAAGDAMSPKNLPFGLRKSYLAEKVLGKGAYGWVIQVRLKKGGKMVAIKIVVPNKGSFSEAEVRHLKREANLLEMFTQQKCEHAVCLAGAQAVQIMSDICWFIMELLDGQDLNTILKDPQQGPINDSECIRVARSVLAALKIIHANGVVHRDIKPANIMRVKDTMLGIHGGHKSCVYKLVDFGTALGIDETVAHETMMTLSTNRGVGAGTPPYMSPEMFLDPQHSHYPTDLWSLGVSLFEIVSGILPFQAETDLLWGTAITGNMDEKVPNVLDVLAEDRRSTFDHNLAKVIAKALEKKVKDRYQSADEMHDEVYRCLIGRGEAHYSVFISYRVASEAPFARLLFDELNHTVTPGGHRVTVFWDAYRLVKGEDWEEGFATGLLNSLCFFPLLSYGSTAPLAQLPPEHREALLAKGWEDRPVDRLRLRGTDDDPEDNVLKELLIAATLLDRRAALNHHGQAARPAGQDERGMLQLAYPVLIGRQQPAGHPDYPRMGDFFHVQGGGGQYVDRPSPPTARAVAHFLSEKAQMPPAVCQAAAERSVAATVRSLLALQGCRMWDHPAGLAPAELTRQQRELVGKGCAGPPVDLDDASGGARRLSVPTAAACVGVDGVGGGVGVGGGGGVGSAAGGLTAEQRERYLGGLDEEQVKMLKAEILLRVPDFHSIIDRAVDAHSRRAGGDANGGGTSIDRAVEAHSRSTGDAGAGDFAAGRGPGGLSNGNGGDTSHQHLGAGSLPLRPGGAAAAPREALPRWLSPSTADTESGYSVSCDLTATGRPGPAATGAVV